MSDSPAATVTAPAKPSRPERVLHALVTLLAAAGVALVLLCVVVTFAAFELIPAWLSISLYVAVPLVLSGLALRAIWKHLRLRWPLFLLLGSSALLLYLAWDDAAPPPAPALAPLGAAGSKSYATYRWMMKGVPDSRLKEQAKALTELPFLPDDPTLWTAAVLKDCKPWETAWAADTLGREWYAAMAAHAPDGLYPYDGNPEQMLSSYSIRRSTQCHWARACLLQHDGQADAAAQVLLTVLRAHYHLQRGATGLVPQGSTIICLKGTYSRLGLLLDSGALSAGTRAQLAGVLQEAAPTPDNIQRAFLGEEVFAHASLRDPKNAPPNFLDALPFAGKSRFLPTRVLGPLLINPHRTEREYLEFLRHYSRLAQQRRSEDVPVLNSYDYLKQHSLKNPLGRILPFYSLVAFNAFTKTFWTTDDLRLALLKRLEEPR